VVSLIEEEKYIVLNSGLEDKGYNDHCCPYQWSKNQNHGWPVQIHTQNAQIIAAKPTKLIYSKCYLQ